MKKATDAQLVEAYERLHNVWKVADEFGMCGQSVHERLARLGKINPINVFTPEEVKRLEREYIIYRDAGKLDELAESMGRTKHFICRQAGKLGLTDRSHKALYSRVWEPMPDDVLHVIMEKYQHAQGTLDEFCKRHGYGAVGFERECKKRFPGEWEAIVELKKSRQPMYRRGRDFEYTTKRNLEKHDYIVLRSPASKTPADLVAVKSGTPYFIQCKLHGAMGVTEWNEFIDYAEKAGATPILAQRAETGRGVVYHLITGRKDGTKRPQPMERWEP